MVCFVCVGPRRQSELGIRSPGFVLGDCQKLSEALKRIESLEWISLGLDSEEGEAHHTIPFHSYSHLGNKPESHSLHAVTAKLIFNAEEKQQTFARWQQTVKSPLNK